jgi:transcriptional regulator with PAS, ATPase and Fis domain
MEFVPLALGSSHLDRIIGECDAIRRHRHDIKRAAPCQCDVLILGETGTGKEGSARALHELSPRRSKPFIIVNCGAIPEHLIESELFGHVKGAFTGAHANQKGAFEAAHGGSIFLDEVAELPLAAQVKLLRVLQERRFKPVGATYERETDARIIAATHRNLESAVAEGRLREDFYYRVRKITLLIPPLRERGDDIRLLVQHFLFKVWPEVALKGPAKITREAMECLCSYPWPGNVRQLENELTNLSFRAEDSIITKALVESELHRTSLSEAPSGTGPEAETLNSFIRSQEHQRLAFIEGVIDMERGNVAAAARRLNIPRSTLLKMRGRLSNRLA